VAERDRPAGDVLAAEFARWAAAARARDAAGADRRARWLGQQAGEAATWAGTLLDLAERETPALVTTGAGVSFGGTVVGVGRDFCVMADARRTVMVRLSAATSVRGTPGRGKEAGEARASTAGAAAGDRLPSLDATFRDALDALAADRSPVRLVLAGGDQVAGDLIGLGVDVASVRLDEPSRMVTYVSLDAVVACWPA
jgi:hypothetical protein